MTDLTQGPVARHLLSMAAFIGAGLAFQAAYVLVDLYFVAALGPGAIAGVSAAANTSYLVMAATQLLGVGVTSLIARARGAARPADGAAVFNQAIAMAGACFVLTLLAGLCGARPLVGALAANRAAAGAGTAYLLAALPSFAAMFPTTVLVATLRGAGIVRPTMLLQTGSVLLNAVLAPILIAGWLTHRPLGTAGAGLASSIAALATLATLALLFGRLLPGHRLAPALLRPRAARQWQIIAIGLPVAGEFGMLFLVTTIIYFVVARFGADAQAGFGIGSRIMTSIFLPAMAVAFAVAPVAGQNMGAGRHDRVRATFLAASLIGSLVMLALTVLCHLAPLALVRIFTANPAVQAVATQYLRIASYNFVAVGLVFVASGLFQALGNTVPGFLSSASRLVTYALPALLLRRVLSLEQLWFISVASITLQAVLSFVLARAALSRLPAAPSATSVPGLPA